MKLSEIERWYIISKHRLTNGTDRELRHLSDLDLGLMHCVADADNQPVTLPEFSANVNAWFSSQGLTVEQDAGAQPAKRAPQQIEVALKDDENFEERAGALLGCLMQPKVVGPRPPAGAQIIQLATATRQREA